MFSCIRKKNADIGEAYRAHFTEETRKAAAVRIKEKYPKRVPVVVCPMDSTVPSLSPDHPWVEWAVPATTTTMMSLKQRIRKYLKQAIDKRDDDLYVFGEEHSLHFIVGVAEPTIYKPDDLVSRMYEESKEDDGMMYLGYAKGNSFG